MAVTVSSFVVRTSLRVPGLGILALPAAPLPDWLVAAELFTPLALRLHRPGQPPLALRATVEEVSQAPLPPARALLLDADLDELPPSSHLSLESIVENELF